MQHSQRLAEEKGEQVAHFDKLVSQMLPNADTVLSIFIKDHLETSTKLPNFNQP